MTFSHGSRIPRLPAKAILGVGTTALTFTFIALCASFTLFTPTSPSHASDDWEPVSRATPREAGVDGDRLEALRAALRANPEWNQHSVLLVTEGRLVFEEYLGGEDENWGRSIGLVEFDAETLHDLRSVTKSVTSLLVGIAIDRGLVPGGLDARAVDLLPDYAEIATDAARKLRVRDLLTMSAGLEWDETIPYSNPKNSEIQMTFADDPIQFVLSRPGVQPAGTQFVYSGGCTTVLAAILEARSGVKLTEWAREVLFDPLGIETLTWHTHARGLAMAASGLRLRPRDLAKIGQLVLQGGTWRGNQIVSREWIAESTKPVIAPNRFVDYAMQWWVQSYSWGGRDHEVPVASGLGGQRIFVLRDLDSVVVMTAGQYAAQGLEDTLRGEALLIEFVLPALGSGPVDNRLSALLRKLQLAAVLVAIAVPAGVAALVIWRRRRVALTEPS